MILDYLDYKDDAKSLKNVYRYVPIDPEDPWGLLPYPEVYIDRYTGKLFISKNSLKNIPQHSGADYSKKQSTYKGNCGEDIVKDYLEQNGSICIFKLDRSDTHPVDFVCYDWMEERWFFIDAKTKVERDLFFDLGIDGPDVKTYSLLEDVNQTDVVIFFPEYKTGVCFSATLKDLKTPHKNVRTKRSWVVTHYPQYLESSNTWMYPTKYMKNEFKLSDDQIFLLDQLNVKPTKTSWHEYKDGNIIYNFVIYLQDK